MGEEEFWRCTPIYFAARQKAQSEKNRTSWEQTRLIAYYTLMPPVTRGRLKMTDIIRFSWDQETVFEPIDPEAIRKFNEESDAFMATQLKPPQ